MAFLRSSRALLFGVVAAMPNFSRAAIHGADAVTPLVRGARMALACGYRNRAPSWAERLKGIDAELADLYRLAWLGAVRDTTAPIAKGTLKWKATSEFWDDERRDAENRCALRAVPRDLDALEADSALREILEPHLTRGYATRAAMREALKEYAFWKFSRTPGATAALESYGPDCEWEALRIVVSPNPGAFTNDDIGRPFRQCASRRGSRWTWLHTRVGDLWLKRRQASFALAAFEAAAENVRETPLPRGLWYRLALAALLARQKDDLALRAGFQALEPSETVPPLDAFSHESLSRLFCARFADLGAREALRLFKATFREALVPAKLLQLTVNCDATERETLLSALVGEPLNARERARVAGLLLDGALSRRELSQARRWASLLAKISQKHPMVSHAALWSMLEKHPENATSVATAYRRAGRWLPIDERRLDLLQRRRQASPSVSPSGAGALRAETMAHPEPLKLTAIYDLLPTFELPLRAETDFATLFVSDGEALAAAGSNP